MIRNRLLLIFTALTFLNSCGAGGPLDFVKRGEGHTRQHNSTDPIFKSYVKTFEKEAQRELEKPNFKVGDVPINFGDTENPDFVGVCFTYSNGQREVIVRETWWERSDELARQALIFHELGHCRLDRGHEDETTTIEGREVRLSLMHSRMVYLNDYQQYKDEYHQELYTQRSERVLSSLRRGQSQAEGQGATQKSK